MIDHIILVHTYINMCIIYICVCVCVWERERERKGFPGGSDGKESTCSAGDLGLIPGLERSPGKGHGDWLQYSCLENPMDSGAWHSSWYHTESDTTEQLSTAQHSIIYIRSWHSSAKDQILNIFILWATQGNGFQLQVSGFGNSTDRGAWQAIVHEVTESDTTERFSQIYIQMQCNVNPYMIIPC